MTVLTSSPKQQFFTNNGEPAVGYKLFTYAGGTTTKKTTYTDSTGLSSNANPIILDYRGEASIWINPNEAYKYVLARPSDTDPPTNPIWTVDQLRESVLISLYGGVDTGTANAYVLTYTANFTTYVDGTVIYWIPSNTNTGGSTLNVNGLGAVPILDPAGFTLAAGAIIANQITAVIYRSGSFYLLSVSVALGSFTGTITGVTVATTGTVFYKIAGGSCTLYVTGNIFGTSNTNAMTMTGVPAICRPSVQRNIVCSDIIDDSISVFGVAGVGTGGGITFSTMQPSGARVIPSTFTAANNKGLSTGWTVTYPL